MNGNFWILAIMCAISPHHIMSYDSIMILHVYVFGWNVCIFYITLVLARYIHGKTTKRIIHCKRKSSTIFKTHLFWSMCEYMIMYLCRQLLSTMGPSLCIISSRAFNNNNEKIKLCYIHTSLYKYIEFVYAYVHVQCICHTYLYIFLLKRNEEKRKLPHTSYLSRYTVATKKVNKRHLDRMLIILLYI